MAVKIEGWRRILAYGALFAAAFVLALRQTFPAEEIGRASDHEDAISVIRRQGDLLDDNYVVNWLRQFEQALDDSTLVAEYQGMRQEHKT